MPKPSRLPEIKDLPFVKCARHGCINRGIWGLKFCVPARGFKLFEHAPMTALVGVQICDEHIQDVRAEEFLTQDLINQMTAYAAAANKQPPDFARAYMDGVPVNELEWLQFQTRRPSQQTH